MVDPFAEIARSHDQRAANRTARQATGAPLTVHLACGHQFTIHAEANLRNVTIGDSTWCPVATVPEPHRTVVIAIETQPRKANP